jgi:hypothetical protein
LIFRSARSFDEMFVGDLQVATLATTSLLPIQALTTCAGQVSVSSV